MRKDAKKFQILDGFRHSFLRAPRARSVDRPELPPPKASSHIHSAAPSGQDLVATLTAMEQRLSALLEDGSRIGQNLHDCILQSLYTIKSTLQTTQRAIPYHTTNTNPPPTDIVSQINQLIDEIRQMIQGLNEGVAKDPGLTADLYALKSIYDEIGHVRITLDLQPTAIEVLTRDEEQEILSIVREALSNCARHAHAAHATVSIRRRGAKIRVHINDDGKGFAVGDGRNRGYALVTMECRARKIGGVLRIQSKESRGTQITVEFSLEPMLAPV